MVSEPSRAGPHEEAERLGVTGLLHDRVAVVTGAAAGIGRATAMLFASAGAQVVVADVNQTAAHEAEAEIKANDGIATAQRCDVTSSRDVENLIAFTERQYGGVDVVVANAGVNVYGTVETTDEVTWDHVFAVNLNGAYRTAHFAIPAMRRRGGGVFLFTASDQAVYPRGGSVAYSAGKAAIVNMVKVMAMDHGPHNIRVNCVCPGPTRTAMAAMSLQRFGVREEEIGVTVPYQQRLAEPLEVAKVHLFLASDLASFVSGVALVVDGAHSAGAFTLEAEPA